MKQQQFNCPVEATLSLMVRWSFVVAPVITLLLYWFKLPLLIVIRLFKVIVSARGEAALAASSCS